MYSLDRAPAQFQSLHPPPAQQAGTPSIHSVQFYEDNALFLDSLSEYLGAALGAGGACLVIATQAHRDGLAHRLKAHGIDVPYCIAMNRLISLEASETLAQFMVEGYPDEKRFYAALEPQLNRARTSLRSSSATPLAFGEMVSLLWEQGRHHAAIELERLWNLLAQRHAFSLRCAYPIGLFSDPAQRDLFRQVCSAHHHIFPPDSYTTLKSENEHRQEFSTGPQKAWTMQTVMKGRQEEIAHLKQMEARLQRSEEFTRSILDSSVDCIHVLDVEGRFQYVSPTGLRSLEVNDLATLLGRRWVELWDPADRPRAEVALAVASQRGVGSFTVQYATPSGAKRMWEVRITPAHDGAGQVDRLIAACHDISDLRAAQHAALESERQAGAGRMAASIAHEINNPLEAVTNFIFLAMCADGIPEDARKHLEMADRELGRAAQITRQMLGFYRNGSKPRRISLPEVVQDVASICDRKMQRKQLSLTVSVDPTLEVWAKEGELRQILLNLTSNAVDASRPGGKIWFRARRTTSLKGDGQGIRITIADNGAGIPPDVKSRIFVPFFTTKEGAGNGIGLWITKCLVEQHGGYVRFRSSQRNNSGTVMSIFLPAPASPATAVAEVA